jgi:hypothetical protein
MYSILYSILYPCISYPFLLHNHVFPTAFVPTALFLCRDSYHFLPAVSDICTLWEGCYGAGAEMCAECENYLLGGACLPACPPGYYPAISRTLGQTFVFREKKKQIITGMFRDIRLVSYF